jgi:hypothetical protein
MPGRTVVSMRTAVEASLLAVAGTAVAGYLAWVDLRPFGTELYWNGFGMFSGTSPAGYGPRLAGLVNPLAWVIVAAVALGGLALIGSMRTMPWLRYLAVGFAAIAVVTAAACLIHPDILVGDLLTEFGIEELGARAVVNTTSLWAEFALTGMFLLSIVGIIVAARRTPPEAASTGQPAPHPAPPADG